MSDREIDEGVGYAGFDQALALIRAHTRPVGKERLPLSSCPGYVCATQAAAGFDYPTCDSSLKDGFAVRSKDVAGASPERPVKLTLAGSAFAGTKFGGILEPGQAVRICTGAFVPDGADAVVSSELCEEAGREVIFRGSADIAKNIMKAGADLRAGTVVVREGQMLLPARLAFAASAGIAELEVYRKPRVAILSVGDELVLPGQDFNEGSVFASNSVNIASWLSMLDIASTVATVGDDAAAIRDKIEKLSLRADAIITNGGLMHSERDLVVGVLESLGWNRIFRHVRMGPGKGTSFGLLRNKPVFCLSGGPTSSGAGFVSLALAGIHNMCGLRDDRLLTVTARLAGVVKGRHLGWTEFSEARLKRDEEGRLFATPLSKGSRSQSMAEADCLIRKPEGVESLSRDRIVTVHLMAPALSQISC